MSRVWTIENFVFELYSNWGGDVEIDTEEEDGAVCGPDEEGFDFEVFDVDCWKVI